MESKIIAVFVGFMLLNSAAHACPGILANGKVSDLEIEMYLQTIEFLHDGEQKNQTLELCFSQIQHAFTWSQASAMMNAARDVHYGSHHARDAEQTQDRMGALFLLDRRDRLKVEEALAIISTQNSGIAANLLVETYAGARVGHLSWEQLNLLLTGLRDVYFGATEYGDLEQTHERIVRAWRVRRSFLKK